MDWHHLLPIGVHASFGSTPASAELSDLSSAERSSIAGASPTRLREFAAGRWHARRALAALRHAPAKVPRRNDGSPAWPPGVVGSLAHTLHEGRLFAVAVVADAAAYERLGVDMEAPGRIEPRLWPTIFRPSELDALLCRPMPSRGTHASLLWSAREAAVKACGNRVGLGAVEVELEGPDGAFRATSACTVGDCVGRVLADPGGWVFALAFKLRP